MQAGVRLNSEPTRRALRTTEGGGRTKQIADHDCPPVTLRCQTHTLMTILANNEHASSKHTRSVHLVSTSGPNTYLGKLLSSDGRLDRGESSTILGPPGLRTLGWVSGEREGLLNGHRQRHNGHRQRRNGQLTPTFVLFLNGEQGCPYQNDAS